MLTKACLFTVVVLVSTAGVLSAKSEPTGTPSRPLDEDALRLSCILIEGSAIEKDFLILPDTRETWLRSSFVYSLIGGDTLVLLSDTSALGLGEILCSRDPIERAVDGIEGGVSIEEYTITAHFPSGICLPVSRISIVGPTALLEVRTFGVLIEGLDYAFPETCPSEAVTWRDQVSVVGPYVGSGMSVVSATVSRPGHAVDTDDFVPAAFTIDKSLTVEHFAGAPVFVLSPEDDLFLLFGFVANRGPGTSEQTFVQPVLADPSWVDTLSWVRLGGAETFANIECWARYLRDR